MLFLCTGTSARSQVAEGLFRKLLRERADVFSAGTSPTAEVHCLAADVLSTRFQVDTDDLYPKHLNRFLGQAFDYVITVSETAQAQEPFLGSIAPECADWDSAPPVGGPD